MIKEQLKKLIQEALAILHFDAGEISLEHPENAQHGDYSTSVALAVAQKLGKNPREVADVITSKLQINKSTKTHDRSFLDFIEKVEVAGPGFINFFLSKEYFFDELQKILKDKKASFGLPAGRQAWRSKRVMIEFTDPNPFKEFHIGHLYSNIVGETLCKILEANGAKVKRANYQGDVGLHVAKAIWGMIKKLGEEHLTIQDVEKKSLQEKAQFLGQSYAKGAAAFEESEEAKKEIVELNKKIFVLDSSIKELYQKGKKWSLEYFETIYKRLGTKFDFYYFESEVGRVGLKLVQENLKKGIFKESEGAVIFPGEQYGLHNRVFINSQGLPTYEAKELGLAPTKYKDFKYDQSIIITANEVNEYFKVLIAVLKMINPELGEKTMHIGHGVVRLPEGKMSSRTGNVVTGEQLIDRVKAEAEKIMESAEKPAFAKASAGREKIAEAVALGAVKYSLLRVGIGSDIIFDFEKSLSLQGDSGPYLQYTYARCKSILRKAEIAGPRNLVSSNLETKFLSKEEMAVLRLLPRLGEMVREAAEKFSPNLLCNFVFELASSYNLFYNRYPVLEAQTQEQKKFRLMLTAATAQVLKNALSLLGIEALERM